MGFGVTADSERASEVSSGEECCRRLSWEESLIKINFRHVIFASGFKTCNESKYSELRSPQLRAVRSGGPR